MAIKENRFAHLNDAIRIPIVKTICAVFVLILIPVMQSSPTLAAPGDITISGSITQGSSGNLLGPGPFNRYNVTNADGSGTSGIATDSYIRGLLADSSKGFSVGSVYINDCTIGGASGSFSAPVDARTGGYSLTVPAGCTGTIGFSVTPGNNPSGPTPPTKIDYAASSAGFVAPNSNTTWNITLPSVETVTVLAQDTSGNPITNAGISINTTTTSWPAFSSSLPGGGSLSGTQTVNAGMTYGAAQCTTGSSGCAFIVPSNSTTVFTAGVNLGSGLSISDTKNSVVTDSSTALSFTFKNIAEVTSRGSNSGSVKIVSPSGSEVKDQSSDNVSSGTLPAGAIDLVGALNFRVESITAGSSIDVQFVIPAGTTANKVVKPKVGGGFIDLTSYATFNSDSNTVTIRYTDGGIGDADGTANGVIVDPIMFWNFAGTVPSSSSGSSGGDSPSGGGGGGGGAPKQTALYFQVVDPADSTKIYAKPVCVEIYSRTLFPQFMGTGCSGADGRINVLVADAKVSIRVFELGNGAVYREYLGEVANDTFTLDGGIFFTGTTRFAISLLGAKSEAVTPTPTPTPVVTPIPTPTPTPTPTPVATPTPTVTPTPVATTTPTPSPATTKSTFFSTTTSTKNLTKLTIRKATAAVSTKVGKSLQITLPTVGSKNVVVRVTIKDPSGKVFTVASRAVTKNKSYVSPIFKFSKPGTYVVTVTAGTTKRVVTVKVSK